MFDHYLDQMQPDLVRPIRLSVAVLATLSMLAAGSTAMWLAQKLDIDLVAAPTATMDLIQLAEMALPEPPPPPPVIETVDESDGSSGGAAANAAATPKVLEESLPAVKPAARSERRSDSGPVVMGVPSSNAIPGGIGIPGITGLPKTGSGGPGTGRGPGTGNGGGPTTLKPFSSVISQAVYSPDPDHRKLMTTATARTDKRSGESVVQFCVGTDGKVSKAKTVKAFANDPEVDRICRDTVKQWRFRPFLVGGTAIEVCSKQTFQINFE